MIDCHLNRCLKELDIVEAGDLEGKPRLLAEVQWD
jgi:hypothetical protein